jgi:hypothetical protein
VELEAAGEAERGEEEGAPGVVGGGDDERGERVADALLGFVHGGERERVHGEGEGVEEGEGREGGALLDARGALGGLLRARRRSGRLPRFEKVIPEAPIRQWVCSLPWRLRVLLGYDRELCADVLEAFVVELSPPFGAGRRRRSGCGDGRGRTRAR